MAIAGSGIALSGLNASTAAIACDTSALIAAIEAANVNPGPDTITLASACVYSFTAPYSSASTNYGYWVGSPLATAGPDGGAGLGGVVFNIRAKS